MALRWKPTIPEDNNPDDQTGSLRHYPFAQVVRVQSGPDQGRFRWYLNELPGATTIKKQGVEESLEAAKQAADEQFRSWLTWTGLAPAVTEPETVPVASSTASPAPSPPRPVDPPEQRLPRYLAPLCEGLAAYVEEHGPALDSLYRWKIPAVPRLSPSNGTPIACPRPMPGLNEPFQQYDSLTSKYATATIDDVSRDLLGEVIG